MVDPHRRFRTRGDFLWSTKVHLWSTGLPILTNSDHKFFGIKVGTNGYTSEKFRKSGEKWWAKRDSNPRIDHGAESEKQVNVDRVAPQGGSSLCTVCRLCRVFLQTCNNVQRTLILGSCHNKENSPFPFGDSPTRLRSFAGRIRGLRYSNSGKPSLIQQRPRRWFGCWTSREYGAPATWLIP